MRRPIRAVFAGLVAAGGSLQACGAHEELTPPIAVQPGAAARAVALMGHGGPNDPTLRRASADDAGEGEGAPPEVAQGSIAFSCLEARGAMRALALVPCAVTISGSGATSAPEVDLVSENGKVAVSLGPGTYRVTASRGLEYARAAWDAEVHAGKRTWGPNEGATVLRRVVDTRGYLAVDVPAHSPGPGPGLSPADVRDAIFDDVADGVEAVVGDSALVALVAPMTQSARIEDLIAPVESGDFGPIDAWSDPDAFLARVAAKHPATAVAPSPARTYVRVDDDGSLATWSPAREADLLRGVRDRRDVVLTNGPFLRVTANGASIGGLARTGAGGDVEVKVHVECAAWVSVDTVSVVRASGAAVAPQPIALRPTAADGRAGDATFHLRAAADDAFVVVASASSPAPDASVDPASPTRAMTGALWIDADGDGESLGRRAP